MTPRKYLITNVGSAGLLCGGREYVDVVADWTDELENRICLPSSLQRNYSRTTGATGIFFEWTCKGT
jgi:hypothetical protein